MFVKFCCYRFPIRCEGNRKSEFMWVNSFGVSSLGTSVEMDGLTYTFINVDNITLHVLEPIETVIRMLEGNKE